MKLAHMTPGLVGIVTGFGASLCCVLPLTVVALGLGSGAFMSITMAYRPILYPLGLIGLGTSYYLYFRQIRVCDLKACRMEGKRFNLFLLAASTLLMGTITYVDFFVETM